MEKKLCYIAGKIGDLPVAEFTKNFQDAEKEVEALGYTAISPLAIKHDHEKTWQAYMRRDIRALIECHAVYALRNWRQSPGATIEVNLAVSLGIDVIFQPLQITEA